MKTNIKLATEPKLCRNHMRRLGCRMNSLMETTFYYLRSGDVTRILLVISVERQVVVNLRPFTPTGCFSRFKCLESLLLHTHIMTQLTVV